MNSSFTATFWDVRIQHLALHTRSRLPTTPQSSSFSGILSTVLSRLLHTAKLCHSLYGFPQDEADPVDGSAPASDRAGWSDWETNDKITRKKQAGGNSTGGRGSSGAKGGRGGKSGGAGAGRGKGNGKGKGRAGVRVGSEGERQLDLASSFKAGALSESARQGHTLIWLA